MLNLYPSAQPSIEIRGHTSRSTQASQLISLLSRLVDTCIILVLFLGLSYTLRIWLYPRFSLVLLLASLTAFYWISQKKLFGLTLGQRAWHLKPKSPQGKETYSLKEPLYQLDLITPWITFSGTLITVLMLLLISALFRQMVFQHPIWLRSPEWKLKSFIPDQNSWSVSPFFYIMGAWPKNYRDHPVFYTIPYEVGPPTRFLGHVIAYWEHPHLSVTFEGPKTPNLEMNRYELKKCFTDYSYSLHCFSVREQALKRHVQEIESTRGYQSWSFQWFKVENPLLPSEETPEGIYIHAVGRSWLQDRFILITAKGTHQTIILRRLKDEKGEEAFHLLQNSIGSVRSFEDLYPGRAWVNNELESTHLKDIPMKEDLPSTLSHLSQIQQRLISKITVDPADFNSYFHLAGTSTLLAKVATHLRLPIQIALTNLESAEHFAADLNPTDPRLGQIRNLDLEMKKLLKY